MQAIDILMDEHRTIERVLDALERAAARLERDGAVRPGFFLDAVTFVAGFADGCHHHKEEGVLFPAMIESGMPPNGGPIAVMLQEHEEGRQYARAIRDAASRLDGGDAAARRPLVAAVRGYVALLRDHIVKEDDVLFPMAGQLLPPARRQRLAADFERVDAEGTKEHTPDWYRALADALSREAAALDG